MPQQFAGFEFDEIAGVPVLWRSDDRFKTFRLVFHARRPLESTATAAARSVLPALMLQGTARDPDRPALARRMELLYGAGVVPSTHRHGESQVLRLTLDAVAGRFLPGRPDQWGEGLGFLADYLTHPRLDGDGFPLASFEREREMAVDVARGLIDDRGRYALQRALEIACAGEPMAIRDDGGPAALEGLGREDPETARRDFLRRGTAWIVACGSLPEDAVVDRAGAFLQTLPQRDPEPIGLPVLIDERPRRAAVECVELRQSKLVLVFRLPWTDDAETWVARRLFVNMLGGGPHSRLFKEVREKRSLAYYASASVGRHKGLVTVQIGLDEAAAQACEAETVRQIDELCAGRFDDQELEIARAGLLSAVASVDDSIARRSEFTSEQWLLGSDRTPAQLGELYRRADREQVARAVDGVWLDTSYLLAPGSDAPGSDAPGSDAPGSDGGAE